MQYLLKFLQQLRFDFSTKRDFPQFIFFRFTSNLSISYTTDKLLYT